MMKLISTWWMKLGVILILGLTFTGCSVLNKLLKVDEKLANEFLGKYKKERPLTTNIKDRYPTFKSLPKFNESRVSESIIQTYNTNGSVHLNPGVYDFRFQSYCLHAGKYAPGAKGNGYVIAPLKGARAKLVGKILRSYGRGSYSQTSIQMLLWSIETGTKYEKMSARSQQIARELLTPDEINSIRSSFWEKIPSSIRSQITTKLKSYIPSDIRDEIDAYSRIKSKIESADNSFESIERLAVKTGLPPISGEVLEVKPGEWSLTNKGYFLRTSPNGYNKSHIQVYVPKRGSFIIKRDAKNRITQYGVRNEFTVTLAYNENYTEGSNLPKYSSVKLTGKNPHTGKNQEFSSLGTSKLQGAIRRSGMPDSIGDIIHDANDLKSDYDTIKGLKDRLEALSDEDLDKLLDLTDSDNINEAIDNLVDVRDLVDLGNIFMPPTSIPGIQKDLFLHLIDYENRLIDVWAHVLVKLKQISDGIKSDGNDGENFDMSDNVGTPGNTHRQRQGYGSAY